MNQIIATYNPSADQSLIHFIFREKRNRSLFITAVLVSLLQFVVFKLLYPFPDFFSDSYSFIYAAENNMAVNLWPIGYSKFLLFVHQISHSDLLLIFFQYFLVVFSSLYFFFTILYWYPLSRTPVLVIYAFLFFNPLILYLSNYVSSEGIFLALSLGWLTQLLWIIYKPQPYLIITHAILLLFAFAVRYNAIYYPMISALAFIFSRQRIWFKVVGFGSGVLLIAIFYIYTTKKMHEVTGAKEFSVLGGWHLANSAMYMYPNIQVNRSELPTMECVKLDKMVKKYFDTMDVSVKGRISPAIGAFYLKDPAGPLKNYMYPYFIEGSYKGEFIAWATVAPVFSDYGIALIKQQPFYYLRYYLLPNTLNYFIPPLEKLAEYDIGRNDVPTMVQDWFDYVTPDVRAISYNARRNILYILPGFFMTLNIAFIICFLLLIFQRNYKQIDTRFKFSLILITVLLLVNFGFSVFASPIVFRYQVFPMIICLSFSLLMIELLDEKEKKSIPEILKVKIPSFSRQK